MGVVVPPGSLPGEGNEGARRLNYNVVAQADSPSGQLRLLQILGVFVFFCKIDIGPKNFHVSPHFSKKVRATG